MKHAFLFHQPPLYQGMVCPLSSPGKKAHNFNTDNSSNGLLDKWKEFHCLYLFIHINSLLVNFSAKGKMNWISRSQSMGRWTLSPLRQSGVKRGSVDLEVCEILLSVSVMSSTTHFSVIKAEKFCGKEKTLPFCSVQIYPSYLIAEIIFTSIAFI